MPQSMWLLKSRPGERVDKNHVATQISRAAAEIVVGQMSFPWYEKLTERKLKMRRSNLGKYKRRIFTDLEDVL